MIGVILYFDKHDGDYLRVELPVQMAEGIVARDCVAVGIVNANGFDEIKGIELKDFEGKVLQPEHP